MDLVHIVGIVVGGAAILIVISMLVWLVAVKIMFRWFNKSTNKMFKDWDK